VLGARNTAWNGNVLQELISG